MEDLDFECLEADLHESESTNVVQQQSSIVTTACTTSSILRLLNIAFNRNPYIPQTPHAHVCDAEYDTRAKTATKTLSAVKPGVLTISHLAVPDKPCHIVRGSTPEPRRFAYQVGHEPNPSSKTAEAFEGKTTLSITITPHLLKQLLLCSLCSQARHTFALAGLWTTHIRFRRDKRWHFCKYLCSQALWVMPLGHKSAHKGV